MLSPMLILMYIVTSTINQHQIAQDLDLCFYITASLPSYFLHSLHHSFFFLDMFTATV